MQPLVIGINHTTAPVALRERLAFADEETPAVLAALLGEPQIGEAVALSTCNRTEFYLLAEPQFGDEAAAWLARWRELDDPALSSALYCHQGDAAVVHLMRVACGLDSMVLGEPQILGQVKQAYAVARGLGCVKGMLERWFQNTFAVAKQVRSDTGIGAAAVSVAYAAVQLARQIFPTLAELRVLLVGAGDTSELVARHLYEQGVRQLTVVNRTFTRGEELASRFGGRALPFSELPQALETSDMVISSTASPLPVVGAGAVARALKIRKRQPMLLVDLAVPRDIEAEVGELDDAFLYTVDDLQSIVASNMAGRQQAAELANQMIRAQANDFNRWLTARAAIAPIASYRDEAARLRDQAVERALRQLDGGMAAADVVRELGHRLTNQLTHAPTRALHASAADGDWSIFELLRRALSHGAVDNDTDPT